MLSQKCWSNISKSPVRKMGWTNCFQNHKKNLLKKWVPMCQNFIKGLQKVIFPASQHWSNHCLNIGADWKDELKNYWKIIEKCIPVSQKFRQCLQNVKFPALLLHWNIADSSSSVWISAIEKCIDVFLQNGSLNLYSNL